jgi:hypothetical protein
VGHATFKCGVPFGGILGDVGEHRQPDPHLAGIMAVRAVDEVVGIDLRLELLGRLVGGEGEDRSAQLAVAEKGGIPDRRTQ